MHAISRSPFIAGLLLVAAAPFAAAETPYPDPVAPAVLGRPLDQIRPARPVRPKPLVIARKQPVHVAASHKAAPRHAVAPAATAALTAAPPAAAPAATQPAPGTPHIAKQAVDDRADPNARIVDNVGKGTHIDRQPLAPGVYLSSKDQALVRKYYAANPVPATSGTWKIGEKVPPKASLKGVPDNVRAALPQAPGYQYVQVDGEVVLVAEQSRVVVDGVSRNPR